MQPLLFNKEEKMQQNKELKEREDALKAKEQDLKERAASLTKREQLIERREMVAGSQQRLLSKDEQKLINEARKVYKIPKEYLFHSRIDEETGEAVIVTNGGKKLRHRKGEEAKCKLTEVQITGERKKERMVWHKKLNQRIPLIELFKG